MINYQKKLDELINSLDYTPTLLLHSCCAPCSSYVLEYLSNYFKITIFIIILILQIKMNNKKGLMNKKD